MSETMTQPCETCWAVAWEPIELEEECEFEDHPHEGPHIRCGLCWISRRHGELLREREADRAAIRDMADLLVLFLHPGEPDCAACRCAKTHKDTIQRAQDAKE